MHECSKLYGLFQEMKDFLPELRELSQKTAYTEKERQRARKLIVECQDIYDSTLDNLADLQHFKFCKIREEGLAHYAGPDDLVACLRELKNVHATIPKHELQRMKRLQLATPVEKVRKACEYLRSVSEKQALPLLILLPKVIEIDGKEMPFNPETYMEEIGFRSPKRLATYWEDSSLEQIPLLQYTQTYGDSFMVYGLASVKDTAGRTYDEQCASVISKGLSVPDIDLILAFSLFLMHPHHKAFVNPTYLNFSPVDKTQAYNITAFNKSTRISVHLEKTQKSFRGMGMSGVMTVLPDGQATTAS